MGPPRALPLASIPGVSEAGWTPASASQPPYRLLTAGGDGYPTREAIHQFMLMLLKVLFGSVLFQ